MVKRFVLYGFLGICAEIFWTGMGSLINGDIRLRGFTYIWMFPIYGMIVFLEPIQHKIKNWPLVLRGGVYTILIFFMEYTSGLFLRFLLGVCPWNYTGPLAINGLIRLDFIPIWFCFGIIIEKIHYTIDKISVLLRTQ
ncbi:Putative ABC-transporter type IV [Clostridium acidisoli DSM 12555]|jgi:uncharacterized membrane protein|uniref:Putative ABC-transporter type IV n=1 Tax=Clostridium acidisoli DSM 12555 TaxID=1121291 RepID=A0A1W1XQH2_9CLOT|nr:hypothetical protein [Clostridium acidisoli]SMC25761.1 Putative ABC-transporter type IV [Clostridium acidisoli DSM 12555]